MPNLHPVIVAGRLLQHAHESSGVIPIAAFRIFMAETEAILSRGEATELRTNAERLIDDRTEFGFPTRLGQL